MTNEQRSFVQSLACFKAFPDLLKRIDMNKKALRKKFVVDRKMQVNLAVRLIGYWVGMWAVIFGLPFVAMLVYRSITTQFAFSELISRLAGDFWFPATISLMIMPIVARDSIRFSHRIAGPVFRLRRELKNLADNGTAEEVHPRDGDYCTELADEFNRVVRRYSRQEQS